MQQSQASLGGLGLGADLQTILGSFGGKSGRAFSKEVKLPGHLHRPSTMLYTLQFLIRHRQKFDLTNSKIDWIMSCYFSPGLVLKLETSYSIFCACTCVGKATGNYDTGSRFQHTEKLQFAKEDDGPPVEEASEEVYISK